MVSLKVRASKMTDGRKNLSASSWLHCFRKLAGTMTRMRRLPSAQLWSIKSPASMVLPKPTSSARMAPRESGLRKAKSAASIWCGLRSTWASDSTAVSFSTLSEAQRRVNSWAMYLAWYCVSFMRSLQRGGWRRLVGHCNVGMFTYCPVPCYRLSISQRPLRDAPMRKMPHVVQPLAPWVAAPQSLVAKSVLAWTSPDATRPFHFLAVLLHWVDGSVRGGQRLKSSGKTRFYPR